jgi:glycerophosphoryl diester phosphodiesterase
MRRPLIISHAACGGHAPENTLAGIRAALGFGVDAIEIDVQASADGVPVLMHDLTVDRSTNGRGEVAKLSLEELRSLDAGGEPVPTLTDVLELTTGKALLVIEIKQAGIEERIADVVRQGDALGDVMVWSFFPQALEEMRKAEPRVPAALLVSAESLSRWPHMRELAVRTGLQAVSVFFAGVNEEIARECQRSGLALYTWTVDSEREMERMIALGVDGICTNFPDRTIVLLARLTEKEESPNG